MGGGGGFWGWILTCACWDPFGDSFQRGTNLTSAWTPAPELWCLVFPSWMEVPYRRPGHSNQPDNKGAHPIILGYNPCLRWNFEGPGTKPKVPNKKQTRNPPFPIPRYDLVLTKLRVLQLDRKGLRKIVTWLGLTASPPHLFDPEGPVEIYQASWGSSS